MTHTRLIIGLFFAVSVQSIALPIRFAMALKKIARHTRTLRIRAFETLVRRKHPAAIKSELRAIRLAPSTQRFLTHRLAPFTCTSFATIAAALHYKKQQEAQQKLAAYNADVITIFAHGMKSSAKAGLHRHVNSQRPGAFIQGPLATFDFKDTALSSMATLGQEDDVKQLEQACTAYDGQRKVLVGSSRGASTCINYLGSRNTPHIAAAVVESPFASIETLVSSNLKSLLKWWFPHYQPDGLQPITSAPAIAKDIPIFIFCSKDDEVIPVSQTIDLYKELRKSGHDNAHLMIVDHGAHAKILIGEDGQLVRNTIHAFYKRYNIAHNDSWASEGQQTFNTCQPSDETLTTIIANAKTSSWKTLRRMSGSASGSR